MFADLNFKRLVYASTGDISNDTHTRLWMSDVDAYFWKLLAYSIDASFFLLQISQEIFAEPSLWTGHYPRPWGHSDNYGPCSGNSPDSESLAQMMLFLKLMKHLIVWFNNNEYILHFI